ncbi:hypothetical protein [Metabacillus fastidiosus]|uniref:Uncharacterized protein n=1 Tax=Metabacillus fastidiosus TaxID=1458 RepID=A0ABU6P2N5_9BACI|nr:hypothetical protein [Metabacillus fastidiosus]MED4403330.1 hypothetical protein [Metabacillus fastidiosus]MED4460685.1 hypothetical protein [Metabacillus fastidiosus]
MLKLTLLFVVLVTKIMTIIMSDKYIWTANQLSDMGSIDGTSIEQVPISLWIDIMIEVDFLYLV